MKRYITLHGVNEGDLCVHTKHDTIESYKKMNELFNRRQKMEFTVKSDYNDWSWIPAHLGGNCYYLWHDGTIRTGAMGSVADRFEAGWWKTKEEAEQFLRDWLPQKDWITKEQVKRCASSNDEIAHACSIEHWKQIVLAGVDEHNKASLESKVSIGEVYCALCQRHKCKNSICTLKGEGCVSGCVAEWKTASDDLYDNEIDGAIKLYNKLIETYNKNFGEKKMDSNLDSRIVQVSKDIEVLKYEKRKLEDEKKKKERYMFVKGDLAVNGNSKRLIISINGELAAVNVHGSVQGYGQTYFENNNYRKIGRCVDVL